VLPIHIECRGCRYRDHPGGIGTERADLHACTLPALAEATRSDSAFGVSASARGIAVAVTPGNNGEPAPRRALPAPRASAASACASAQTGALPRRTRRARRVRGAVPTLSARPLCAQGRHHARRGQRHDLGALSGPDSASRAARRPPQRTARPTQADRLHQRQKSPAKPAPPGSRQGLTLTAGQVFAGSEE
jgi:hypothetical protein